MEYLILMNIYKRSFQEGSACLYSVSEATFKIMTGQKIMPYYFNAGMLHCSQFDQNLIFWLLENIYL